MLKLPWAAVSPNKHSRCGLELHKFYKELDQLQTVQGLRQQRPMMLPPLYLTIWMFSCWYAIPFLRNTVNSVKVPKLFEKNTDWS